MKKNVKKRIITVVLVCLFSAIPIVASIYAKLPLNLSHRIENENINDLSLTIYYEDPYVLHFFPISNVGEFIEHRCEKKIVVNGSDLEEHIDLFKEISIDDMKPVVIKSPYLELRVCYVLESRKNGKLLDVAMWGCDGSMIINGVEVKENRIFGDVILPFLSEEDAKHLEDFLIE